MHGQFLLLKTNLLNKALSEDCREWCRCNSLSCSSETPLKPVHNVYVSEFPDLLVSGFTISTWCNYVSKIIKIKKVKVFSTFHISPIASLKS